MKLPITLASALALSQAACSDVPPARAETAAGQDVPADVLAAAVANEARPEAARALDESRKPAEVLAFLGLEQGDHAADLISGGGYWSAILAEAVGASGSVTALEPEQFYDEERWTALTAAQPGIALERYRFEDFQSEPDRFDFAVMNLVYHDLYWESERFEIPRSEPSDYLATLYAAMKPGGVVGVIDHVANPGDTRATVEAYHRIDPAVVSNPGDTRATVEAYHRIDPAVVRADFERAGFVLEDQSEMLANPDDDHTTSVFAPAIRGKTDRFVMRFVKPGAVE